MHISKKEAVNTALHRTAIPLHYIAAGELNRLAELLDIDWKLLAYPTPLHRRTGNNLIPSCVRQSRQILFSRCSKIGYRLFGAYHGMHPPEPTLQDGHARRYPKPAGPRQN